MTKRIRWLTATGVCVLSAVLLIKLSNLLEQQWHPLLSSLICIETDDPRDLYWNINQIELTGSSKPDDRRVWITLRNNIPNFNRYYVRIDRGEQWQETAAGIIGLEMKEGSHQIDVRASNTLGGQLPPATFTVSVQQHEVSVVPGEARIVRGKDSFRFEKPDSAKISWLRAYTLPVIARCYNQWDTYLIMRRWVREQIPYKTPVMKSRWDAQHILQAVWSDSSVGFICDAYAATYVSACISVGLNARMIHLGNSNGNGHYATEVWSDDYGKWIFMDPLYNCHFSLHDLPLSALDLHHLWKKNGQGEITVHGGGGIKSGAAAHHENYFNLFRDIQLVNANDFLSAPLTSAFDLLTSRIRFIRYVDDVNPPYSRVELFYQLLMFYYLPGLMRGVVIPFLIPAYLVFYTIKLFKKQPVMQRGY